MNKISPKALIFAITVSLLGMIATYSLSVKVSEQFQKESYLTLENIAKQVSIRFQDEIDMSINDLQALQAFFSAYASEPSLTQFNHYMDILDIENREHIQALSWVPVIRDNQRDDLVNSINKQHRDFNIKKRTTEGQLIISERKQFYTPVTFVSPYEVNKGAHGFDLSSSVTRRISLERARDTGKMTGTSKIKLIQEKEGSYGFLIIAPIYDGLLPITNKQERIKALLGYVTGVFRINNLMQIVKQQADKEGLILSLIDTDKNNGGLLYGEEQKVPTFSFDETLPDRHWQLNISLNKALQASISSPTIVNWILIGGFIISMLLAFSVYALQLSMIRANHINNLTEELVTQNNHLEIKVAERTNKLAQNNTLLNQHVNELIEQRKKLSKLMDQANLSKINSEKWAKELARSNQDLDEFAYVASHDLKAPLRGIDQISSWIAEDIEAQNLSEIPDHIRLMRSRVQRLEHLLDDLLEYSRANRTTDKVSKINFNSLINDTFELISPPEGFQLTIENDIPDFLTPKAPFEQVIRNLLSNAVKHHDKPNGHIKIRIEDKQDFYKFYFTDDGPGISEQHHDTIFKMFKTLRPRDEIEGSGMGLALIKKIVEHYSGSVNVQANTVNGCTFHFTWPKKFNNDTNRLIENT
jgi:signal transduction histidine kinase